MATRTAHAQKLPCLTLTLDRLDMETFGELFYFLSVYLRTFKRPAGGSIHLISPA